MLLVLAIIASSGAQLRFEQGGMGVAQVGARDKRILQLLVLFLAFYIFTNPDTAGVQARLFFDWVLAQAGSLKTFIDALLDGSAPATSTTTTVIS